MLTAEQIANLNLGIGTDNKTVLAVNAAMDWLKENTTLDVTYVENLPACVQLFIIKFTEISAMQSGVQSESIEGLSLSFSSGNTNDLLWDAAYQLLGGYVKSPIKYVTAKNRWR